MKRPHMRKLPAILYFHIMWIFRICLETLITMQFIEKIVCVDVLFCKIDQLHRILSFSKTISNTSHKNKYSQFCFKRCFIHLVLHFLTFWHSDNSINTNTAIYPIYFIHIFLYRLLCAQYISLCPTCFTNSKKVAARLILRGRM